MVSFSPLVLLALGATLASASASSNCTKGADQEILHFNGTQYARKHKQEFGHAGSWKKHGGSHHHKGAVTHTVKHTATAAPVVRTKTAVATKVVKTKVAATHTATKNVSRKPNPTKKKTTTSRKPSVTHKPTSTKKSSAKPSSSKKPVATHAPTTTKRPITTSKKPTTTSQKPSVTATSKPTGFAAVALAAHNAARKDYGAGAMVWDAKLAADAQKWTDGCLWTHGGANGAGQNLAGGVSSPQAAVDMWMAEAKDYKKSNPKYSHFTQVVWKSSTKLGCAITQCSPLEGSTLSGKTNFIACHYAEAGNMLPAINFINNVGAFIGL